MIAKSVTPKEAGGRKAVRRSAGVEGRSGAGGVSIAARARAPKDLAFEIQTAWPRMRGVERGRSGFARAELWASAKRQEGGCTGESVLPSNTDDVDCVGPQGPSRRSGRSHCMFSSIGRPVQNSTAYPQLAKQTSALCALGVQPEMSPSVFGCKEPRTERYPRSYPSMAACGGAAGQGRRGIHARIRPGQLRASARKAVKGLIPRKMETPRLA